MYLNKRKRYFLWAIMYRVAKLRDPNKPQTTLTNNERAMLEDIAFLINETLTPTIDDERKLLRYYAKKPTDWRG